MTEFAPPTSPEGLSKEAAAGKTAWWPLNIARHTPQGFHFSSPLAAQSEFLARLFHHSFIFFHPQPLHNGGIAREREGILEGMSLTYVSGKFRVIPAGHGFTSAIEDRGREVACWKALACHAHPKHGIGWDSQS
jgi:hypothetical protein